MVDFNDPTIVLNDISALRSFYLTTEGVFFWEIFTTLDYELSILRGRRAYRWTIWIYSFTRITALVMVILNLVYINTRHPINCEIWIKFQVLFGYFSIVAASLLIVIRIIAIWNKNKFVVAIATSIWATNVVASGIGKSPPSPCRTSEMTYNPGITSGVSRLRSEWNLALLQCIVLNSDSSRLNIVVLLITDSVLLLMVLVGLLRLRGEGVGTSGLGRLLWKQGVVWLLIATIAEVPPVVFIIINLNTPFNLMFQLPSVITMSIAATRMYRSLSDFVSSTTDIASDNLPNIDGKVSTLKWNQAAPIAAINRIEVTVDTAEEQYQISQTSRDDICKGTKERPCDQPDGYEIRQQTGFEDQVWGEGE